MADSDKIKKIDETLMHVVSGLEHEIDEINLMEIPESYKVKIITEKNRMIDYIKTSIELLRD